MASPDWWSQKQANFQRYIYSFIGTDEEPWIRQRYIFMFIGFMTTFTVALLNLHTELIIRYMVKLNTTVDLYDPDSCKNLIVNNSGGIQDQNTAVIDNRLIWEDKAVQGVLAAYYNGYIWTQWLGGVADEMVGGKLVMTISIITASVLTILTHVVVMFYESNGFIYLRFTTGLALGPTIPVLLSMMSKWIPKKEYTFIGSLIFPGALIGQVAATYLTDAIVRIVNWPTVCYVYGFFGLILSVLWIRFCYNTPNIHPRISETEKGYLNENVISLKRTTKYVLDALPWKAYLLSAPLWGVTIGYVSRSRYRLEYFFVAFVIVLLFAESMLYHNFAKRIYLVIVVMIGKEWAYHILTVEIPQFHKEVFNFDIKESLYLTSAPYFCMWISAMAFGYSSDFIVNRELIGLKRARQLFTTIGLIGSAISIMLIVYSNCAPKYSFRWMCLGMIALGASYSGVFINVLDLTPNYAGSTMGIVDNLGITVAWSVPILKDWIVSAGLLSQWKLLLWLMLILILLKLGVYLYYMHADQLWWDDVRSHGYPENWKGLFTTTGYIDKDLTNTFNPYGNGIKAL